MNEDDDQAARQQYQRVRKSGGSLNAIGSSLVHADRKHRLSISFEKLPDSLIQCTFKAIIAQTLTGCEMHIAKTNAPGAHVLQSQGTSSLAHLIKEVRAGEARIAKLKRWRRI